MKKFIKKLAFAAMALSVVLVSSCKPEKIPSEFPPENAVFTIEVSVFDATTSTDVTREATISTSSQGVSVSGNNLVITGNPDIKAQTISVTATYKDISATENVEIYAVLAGGQAKIQKQIVINTPVPPTPPTDPDAVAYINICVTDGDTGEVVTSDCTLKSDPDYDIKDGVITITGNKDIQAHDVKITATLGDREASCTVKVDNIPAGSEKTYLASIVFPAKEPVVGPAKVTINVKLFDDATESYVTDFEVEAKSSIETVTPSVSGNVVTITGNDDIAEQTITLTATSTSPAATVEGECEVQALAAGNTAEYNITLSIPKPDIPKPESAEYSIEKLSETTVEEVGTFYSSHAIDSHDYSHDPYTHSHSFEDVLIGHGTGHGTGNWLYNATEFVFSTTIDYLCCTGVKTTWCGRNYESGISGDDRAKVDSYFNTYAANTYKEEAETLNVKVSAFSMYTAYATKKYTTTTYAVYRTLGGVKTKIGTITVKSVSTCAQYTEAALPGREDIYHYGHGHDDHGHDHGHGGSNAGGGIIWAD